MSEDEPVPCTLCGQVPCHWESFGEEIWEHCESQKGKVQTISYKLYTCLRDDVLCRFDRQPLPVCIRGDIITMKMWVFMQHCMMQWKMIKDIVILNIDIFLLFKLTINNHILTTNHFTINTINVCKLY